MKDSVLIGVAEEIRSQCNATGDIYAKYKQAVELNKNGIDRAAFDYLRKVGKSKQYILPAKARFIDRLGPRLRYLKAREARREILYSMNLIDKTSQDEKSNLQVKYMLEQMEGLVRDRMGDIDEEVLALNETIGSIREQVAMGQQEVQVMTQRQQNGEKVSQEEIMSAQQAAEYIQKQASRILIRLDQRTKMLENQKILTRENLDEITQKARTSIHDIKEEKIQSLLETMVFNMNLEEQKKYAFAQSLICGVGVEYYYVDYQEGYDNPTFEAIHPRDVFYPQTANTWVQDGDWGAFRKSMSTEQIIRKFRPGEKIKDLLFSRDTFYSQNMRINVNGGARFEEGSPGSNVYHDVYFIYWMSERNVVWSMFDNKYNPNSPHIHLTEDPSSKPKKKETRETTYITDVYEAVMIDNEFLVPPQLKTEVARSADNYSIPKIPIIGLVFDSDTRKPYSLVLETKDAMELGIVVQFKLELIIALSGVKGFIMDDSQRPSNMQRDEWQYLRKMGTAYIESVKKGGRPASFNQFQTFDDTLPQSIETLLTIDESIEKHYDVATGVTRQSLAQIEQYDLKGTTNVATQQTMMLTEIFYETHERIYCKALEQLINLKAKFFNDKEIIASFYHPEYGYKSVKMPKGFISERDISIIVQDSGRDERMVQTMQQVAMGYFDKGSIPFKALASILSSNSFKKIENKISFYLEDFQNKMFEQQQAAESNKANSEKEKIQIQGEVNKMLKELDMQIQSAKNEIEAKRVNSEDLYRNWEMGFKEKELATKSTLQKYDTDSERAIETTYLGEEKRQSLVDEKLRSLELEVQTLMGMLSEENYKKVELKKAENSLKKKEHIKD